jgi:hypothetical protein
MSRWRWRQQRFVGESAAPRARPRAVSVAVVLALVWGAATRGTNESPSTRSPTDRCRASARRRAERALLANERIGALRTAVAVAHRGGEIAFTRDRKLYGRVGRAHSTDARDGNALFRRTIDELDRVGRVESARAVGRHSGSRASATPRRSRTSIGESAAGATTLVEPPQRRRAVVPSVIRLSGALRQRTDLERTFPSGPSLHRIEGLSPNGRDRGWNGVHLSPEDTKLTWIMLTPTQKDCLTTLSRGTPCKPRSSPINWTTSRRRTT